MVIRVKDLKEKDDNKPCCCPDSSCCATPQQTPTITKEKTDDPSKLKVDLYVPLDACACEWDQFMNGIFAVLTPYIKYIDHDIKNLNSEDARQLNLHNNCVVVDGEKKITSSFMLNKELPKLLKEKGLI